MTLKCRQVLEQAIYSGRVVPGGPNSEEGQDAVSRPTLQADLCNL